MTHIMELTTYNAVQKRAGILELTDHAFIEVTGPARATFLHNLLSNDIKNLPVGGRCYATILTRAGRVIADLHVYAFEESLLLEATKSSIAQAFPFLKKMILFTKAEVKEAPGDIGMISMQGPEAARFAAGAPSDLKKFPNDRTGLSGVDLIGLHSSLETFRKQLSGEGIPSIDAATFEVLRVEAGIPLFGSELNEEVIPLEAGLETSAISFTKGCYTGQEVIARIKTYGDVAKKLVGLKLNQSAASPCDKLYKGGVEVGFITSVVTSPRFGRIALGYVKRDHWDSGTKLSVGQPDGPAAKIQDFVSTTISPSG